MPSYRLYRLDGTGKILSADWIAADADEEAERYAREQSPNGRFELWERGRLVCGASTSKR